MNAFDLLQVIGQAQNAYILDAEQARTEPKTVQKKSARHWKRNLAAAIAIVLTGILFLQTPMGAAAAEAVQEQVAKLIEILFPTKDILVTPEGITDIIPHEAHGKEPNATTPGFAIYIDESRYTMTEEEGIYFIRPLSPAVNLPPCEMEIQEVPGKNSAAVAEEVRNSMLSNWESVSCIYRPLEPPCMIFNASSGMEWDSPREDHYFFENGNLGTYHITLRYFLEAAEGHAVRFVSMLHTFTLIAPQDATQYKTPEIAMQEALAQEAAYAQGLVEELLETFQTDATQTQADMNINAQRRYELWDEVLNKIWDSLERTMDRTSFKILKEEQRQWIDRKEARIEDAASQYEGGSLYSAVYYGTAAEITERRVYELLEYLTGEREVGDVAKETAPKELIPGQSTIEDAVRYYQETFPERNLYANFLDFDGNGWGDLAVWYQGCYLSICFMEEDYILAREVTFTEIANLYEHWDGPTCQPNIIGTWELQENDTVSIETFYDISEGGLLSLREGFKYDGNGGDQKWFTIGDSDWVPISQEVYEERLNCYHGSAENLKPIEDYYLR